jgi:hypothetical protein
MTLPLLYAPRLLLHVEQYKQYFLRLCESILGPARTPQNGLVLHVVVLNDFAHQAFVPSGSTP